MMQGYTEASNVDAVTEITAVDRRPALLRDELQGHHDSADDMLKQRQPA
jgi:hypothetical protein